MTIIWGIFWGAVMGTFWPGYNDIGTFVGGILGLFAGLTLRFVIKKQVLHSTQALSAQLSQALSAQVQAEAAVVTATATTTATAQNADVNLSAAIVDYKRQQTLNTPTSTSYPAQTMDAQAEAAEDAAFWQDELKREQALSPSAARVRANEARSSDVKSSATAAKAANMAMPPAAPSAFEQGITAIQNWFLGGNTIVRVGLVILFIGLSFLARYAAAAGLIPVELRLAVIGAFGIALLAIGFKKRLDKPGFALALQGAGVAVMYLTVFAAFRLYGMLPALAAFGLMIVVCALSCALALLQNSRALAVAAFAGGFAVPILLSTGQGSHVGLFSYYTLLNVAIMLIAYKKSWRILNMVGFVATFGVATAWGALKFAPEQYSSTQPFFNWLFVDLCDHRCAVRAQHAYQAG